MNAALSRFRHPSEVGVFARRPAIACLWLVWFAYGHGGGGDFAIFRRPGSAVLHGHVFLVLSIAAVFGLLWLLGVRDWRCYGVSLLGIPVFGASLFILLRDSASTSDLVVGAVAVAAVAVLVLLRRRSPTASGGSS